MAEEKYFLDTARIQLTVDLTCDSCEKAVRGTLANNEGIKELIVDVEKQLVVVETSLATSEVVQLVESSGKRALVTGIGAAGGEVNSLGSAVAIMHEGNPSSGVKGVTRIVQTSPNTCIFDGTIDGLKPNSKHRLAIHEYGDISDGCDSCGDILAQAHSEPSQKSGNLYGDLGLISSNSNGRSDFRFLNRRIQVWDVIGRSMVLQSTIDSDSTLWKRLACGIIARSAGIFENYKKICACDGTTIWDERLSQGNQFSK